MIIIYTDGSSRGNPGPGGFGVVLIAGAHRKEISEGYKLTTNNRMELLSVIVALETLKKEGSVATIYSDSLRLSGSDSAFFLNRKWKHMILESGYI